MIVPFIDYPKQYKNLKKEIDEAMHRVLERGDLILRKDVDDFEKNLAEFVGTKYAVALNSGTDGLFLSLKAAGIGKNDEMITVSHTFVASIAAIIQVGAKPILVDVGEDYLMDMEKVEKAITKKTKAIIPVHLNGRMCDMDRLMKIAKKHNLVVIEDAAQALGAKYKFQIPNPKFQTNPKSKIQNSKPEWRNAGSIGLTGSFSFYPAKILGSLGDGGAITTNNLEIAEKIRLLRDHGQGTKTQIECYGWNSRLDNIQAAVLNIKLKYLPQWIKRRKEIAEIYNKGLSDINEVKLPPISKDDVFQNYVIRVLTPMYGCEGKLKKRDELYNYLKDRGVETLIKDPIPNHWQVGLHLSKFKLPITEKLSKEVISLPMYPELLNQEIQYIISCIKEFYER